MTRTLLILLGWACWLSPSIYAQEAQDSLILKAPSDWRIEQISFPLAFAPDLPYHGFEDIRFMPGWHEKDSPEFWSYTFVWFIEDALDLNENKLKSIIELYFDGLNQVVRNMNKDSSDQISATEAHFKASLKEGGPAEYYSGKLTVYDAFFTKSPIQLFAQVRYFACPKQERNLVWFMFSPKAFTDPVWESLESVELAIPCKE